MALPSSEPTPHDPAVQRRSDRARLLRAFRLSLGAVLLLLAVFASQTVFDWRSWAVVPHTASGLRGLLTAPLLHGSLEHLAANSVALLILGTLAGSVYPRATVLALPLLWLGSGLGAWLLGEIGSHHLGASGITHGLLFLVFVLGLLRRDRSAIAAAMIAFLFYGGMLLTVLPHLPDVSWQSHLGGALAGVIAALLFRQRDPLPPRQRYSWDDEHDDDTQPDPSEGQPPPSPQTEPVVWQRESTEPGVPLRLPLRNRVDSAVTACPPPCAPMPDHR